MTFLSHVNFNFNFLIIFFIGFKKEDTRPVEEIVREKLLTVLESAYPNMLSVEDLVR